MPGTTLKTGIIGTGKHGSRYARHIVNDIQGLELVAISRRSSLGRTQAEEWNCKWYPDWRDLVADAGIDAVISVVPPTLNLRIATACRQWNKPLLVEKPLAVTATGAETIVNMFKQGGPPLTVAQTLRWNPAVRALKEKFHIVGACHSFVAAQRIEPSTLPWLEDPATAGAGVSLHTAVHLFDAIRFITGWDILQIRAATRSVYNPGVEDILLAQVDCGKAIGVIDTSKVSASRTGYLEFVGEKGVLRGDHIHGILDLFQGMNRTCLLREPPGPGILYLLEEWLDFIRGKGPNPVTGEDGAAAVRACHASLRSASSGMWEST